ncbi:MAG: hypothetical protein ACP5OU_06595 [Methanothrix sp.]
MIFYVQSYTSEVSRGLADFALIILVVMLLHFQAGFAAAWGNVFKSECAAKNIEVQFSTMDEVKIMDDDILSRVSALSGKDPAEEKR